MFICRASCQQTLALPQNRAVWGISGVGKVAEGLILALGEPSLAVKSSSDTTRTTEAWNCPLDFLWNKVKKASRPFYKWSRERDEERERVRLNRNRKNTKRCWAHYRGCLAYINQGSLGVMLGLLLWLMSVSFISLMWITGHSVKNPGQDFLLLMSIHSNSLN